METLTVTGTLAVGLYGPGGAKLHVAPPMEPPGSVLGSQARVTRSGRLPTAVRVTVVEVEVEVEAGWENAVIDEGDGAAMPKSTTSKFKLAKE